MLVVDGAGRGDFTTVQAALDAARAGDAILIRRGVYREKLIVTKDSLTLYGEDARETRLVFGDYAKQRQADGSEKGTFLSYTLLVTGNGVTLSSLTVENDAGDGRVVGQAVALYAAGDRLTVRDCFLLGHQDTLFCGPTFPKVCSDALPVVIPKLCESAGDGCPPDHRQYYENCDIRGDVDFIFGPYRCWFEGCRLLMNDRGMKPNGYFTAANTPESQPFGFVFHRCSLSGDGAAPGSAYLGRPWRAFARTTFLGCDMDECVSRAGWSSWNEKPVTNYYQEYMSTGAGGDISRRHAGAAVLTRARARGLTLERVLRGWTPDKECSKTPRAVSPYAVDRFLDFLKAKEVDMHGFVIRRDGALAAEGYYTPFTGDEPHRLFSVSKTLTALAIGLLLDDGKLSLGDPVVRYFPEYVSDKTPEEIRNTTIADMLSMRTPYLMSAYQKTDEDWTRPFFEGKADHAPGTAFSYDTSASQTLCALAEKLSGKPILSFLDERLLTPLGCKGAKHWLKDGVGTSQGGTGLCMTLSDLSLVADCILRDGDGLVSASFLRAMKKTHALTTAQARTDERRGYGYQLWHGRDGAFVLYGMGGQMAFCLPREGVTVCTSADTRQHPMTLNAIYDAVFCQLVPNLSKPGDAEALKRRLSTLSVPPSPHAPRYGEWPRERYTLAPNPSGILWLRLEDSALCYADAQGEYRLPFGVGELTRATLPGTDEPALVSGGMLCEDGFLLVLRLVGDTPCGAELLFTWKGRDLTVVMRDGGDALTSAFRGTLRGCLDS